ncbi:Fe-S oxidoreductase [Candidatus Omnitrophus magneticus]|uniref:Fe-S oxidoreductase n=1 Tax=Candidatus Omnitrophus magneticus TaxID=1609969 RepID=A0A0F0CR80_9BACT|nr:Fe-S oxidoreductase [Candidatus Omnitrophus magneticus]
MNIQLIKYKIIFNKKDDMVYISHLDLMRVFARSVRRAKLPFFLTGGYTPRIRLSIMRALKLGVSSEREEMFLWLKNSVETSFIAEALNRELPSGIRVLEVTR